MSDAEHPFELMPDTPEQAALEADLNAAVEGLIDRLVHLYRPDGLMPRETPEKQVMSAAGTIMLRCVSAAVARAIALDPGAPQARYVGNGAILLARSAGFFATGVGPMEVRLRLLEIATQEMFKGAVLPMPDRPAST